MDTIIELKGEKDSYIFSPTNPKCIVKEIGESTSVFLGVKSSNNKNVIIKRLLPSFGKNFAILERFKKEAINFEYAGITSGIEYIQIENEHFVIREYVDGTDLNTILKDANFKKKVSPFFVCLCALQICDSLSFLHSNGFLHCDIKPGNIVLLNDKNTGTLNFEKPVFKIIDLGLVCNYPVLNWEPTIQFPSALQFSPPEQLLSMVELMNPSSDLFALAVSLYVLLTKTLPYKHSNPAIITNLQIQAQLPESGSVSKELVAIIKKATTTFKFQLPPNRYSRSEVLEMLKGKQKFRYQTALEMKTDIQNYLGKQNKNTGLFRNLFNRISSKSN